MTPVPHPPYSPNFILSDFFFVSLDKNYVLNGKHFAKVEEVKQKMAEALKGIKINEFKNCFEQWKNSTGVLHQTESTLKVTKFKHVRINTQLLYKFHFLASPCTVEEKTDYFF